MKPEYKEQKVAHEEVTIMVERCNACNKILCGSTSVNGLCLIIRDLGTIDEAPRTHMYNHAVAGEAADTIIHLKELSRAGLSSGLSLATSDFL